jgi:protein-arginine kinase activator protein McsA
LSEALKAAVDKQDYEQAAVLRDQIKVLRGGAEQ